MLQRHYLPPGVETGHDSGKGFHSQPVGAAVPEEEVIATEGLSKHVAGRGGGEGETWLAAGSRNVTAASLRFASQDVIKAKMRSWVEVLSRRLPNARFISYMFQIITCRAP